MRKKAQKKNGAQREQYSKLNVPMNVPMGGNLRNAPIVNKLGNKSPDANSSAGVAGSFVKQLIDPCHSPNAPIPDKYHGKAEFITSTTTVSLPADANGQRGIIVSTCPANLIEHSASTWSSTWTKITDTHQAGIILTDYKYVRAVGQCVRIQKTSASTTANGTILYKCAPVNTAVAANSAWDTAAEMTSRMEELSCESFNPAADVEVAWCPQNESDFVPHLPAKDIDTTSDADIEDRLLNYRPRLFFFLDGATASTSQYKITVITRYECFLLPAKQVRGTQHSLQDSRALDIGMSAIHHINWVRLGEQIARVSSYASKVATAIGAPPLIANGLAVIGKAVGGHLAQG